MRHGQTLFNLRRKIQGACDSPLTKRGIEQAKMAGDYLKDVSFDHFYSSTAERACDTLEFAIGEGVTYLRLKGLKEMNFGTFEGESDRFKPQNTWGLCNLFCTLWRGISRRSEKAHEKDVYGDHGKRRSSYSFGSVSRGSLLSFYEKLG